MHVELILEPAEPGEQPGTVEPFRRTTFEVWDRGRLVAIAGHSHRNRADSLAALERLTGGSVAYDQISGTCKVPVGLYAPDGSFWPIERVQ